MIGLIIGIIGDSLQLPQKFPSLYHDLIQSPRNFALDNRKLNLKTKSYEGKDEVLQRMPFGCKAVL